MKKKLPALGSDEPHPKPNKLRKERTPTFANLGNCGFGINTYSLKSTLLK